MKTFDQSNVFGTMFIVYYNNVYCFMSNQRTFEKLKTRLVSRLVEVPQQVPYWGTPMGYPIVYYNPKTQSRRKLGMECFHPDQAFEQ